MIQILMMIFVWQKQPKNRNESVIHHRGAELNFRQGRCRPTVRLWRWYITFSISVSIEPENNDKVFMKFQS